MGTQSKPNDAIVIYIGGPCATGKSTAANILSVKTGRPVFKLDKILNLVEGHGDTSEVNGNITRIIARALIEEMLVTRTRCIVEGVWIKPDTSAELLNQYDSNYFPVYCGYSEAKAEERLRTITDNGVHWLANKPEPEATAIIQQQIAEDSILIRAEAIKYGLNFIDFSDQSKGCEVLQQLFT